MSETRASEGGFEPRFMVERVDGKPIDASRRYIVLDYSGADPHAVAALKAYADSIQSQNPQFAGDIRAALANPQEWPAQHKYT